MKRITLNMHCPDKRESLRCYKFHPPEQNIVYIDQYVDRVRGIFFMRLGVS